MTLLLESYPDTEYVYMMYFPPLNEDGEHSEVSGSCSLPQLCPNSEIRRVTKTFRPLST